MRFLITAISFLLLSGCYQAANKWDIESAIEACGSLDQVVEIQVFVGGWEFVTCRNSNIYELHVPQR